MRRLLRTLVIVAVVLAGGVFALGAAVLNDEPVIAKMTPPTPEDVETTRAIVHQIRRATEAVDPDAKRVSIKVQDLQGALRLGSRFLAGARAQAAVGSGALRGVASVPVPWFGVTKWLNIQVTIPPFEDRIALESVVVVGHVLSPDLSLRVARLVANLILGNGSGDKILNSASSLRITEQTLVFTLRLDSTDRGDVLAGVFGALRGNDMPPPDQIERYYALIRQAMDDGTLPVRGSFLPYLRFAVQAALDGSTPETLPDAYTAAIFALTRACGAKDFALVVGRLGGVQSSDQVGWTSNCDKVTFANRIDTRRHFITAAAIKAASNRGFAISIGEFKELRDSINGNNGFDFTDIAANNSGIRFSDLFMSQPSDRWPDLITRVQSEADVLADFSGIPGRVSRRNFTLQYGDTDSPAYREMLDLIERQIDKTTLHATPPGK